MAPSWPELPQAGEGIELPMRTPHSLLRALDYPGDAQLVGLYQDGQVGKVTDGVDAVEAEAYSWQLFRDHPMVRHVITAYDIGDRGAEAQHWLVADRGTGKLIVMRPEDAAALLDTQPQTRGALTGGLGPDDRGTHPDTVQRTVSAQPGTDSGWLQSWMDYARTIRAAQRELVRDLNFQAGRSLLRRIHGLNGTVNQTIRHVNDTRRPGSAEWPVNHPQPDLDANPRAAAPPPDDRPAPKPPDVAEGEPGLD